MDGEMCRNSIVPFFTCPLESVQNFCGFLFVEQHGNDVLLYNTIKYMHISFKND